MGKSYGIILSIVIQMLVLMGLSFWGGNKLDEYLSNDKPIYTLIIGLVGMFATIFYTAFRLNKYFDSKKNEEL